MIYPEDSIVFRPPNKLCRSAAKSCMRRPDLCGAVGAAGALRALRAHSCMCMYDVLVYGCTKHAHVCAAVPRSAARGRQLHVHKRAVVGRTAALHGELAQQVFEPHDLGERRS